MENRDLHLHILEFLSLSSRPPRTWQEIYSCTSFFKATQVIKNADARGWLLEIENNMTVRYGRNKKENFYLKTILAQ